MSTFETYDPPEITKKLADISRIMADGFHFINMRMIVEDWQKQADLGDAKAQQAINMIEQFHRLCMAIEGK